MFVVIFISIFILLLKHLFFIIVISCVRNKVYLLPSLLNNLELEADKHIFSGDFSLYFNISLDAKGVPPMLKKLTKQDN